MRALGTGARGIAGRVVMGARRPGMRSVCVMVVGVVVTALLAGCSSTRTAPTARPTPSRPARVAGGPSGTYVAPQGIHKMKHVIMVMQENRSFDSYFGTYPGAAGLPVRAGKPAVCVPNPVGGCTRPYHDRNDLNGGGPHAQGNAVADVHGGRMNGVIHERDAAPATWTHIQDRARPGDRPP